LRRGEALLLYLRVASIASAARIWRNSAVEQLLQAVPDVRVVLVRTAGCGAPASVAPRANRRGHDCPAPGLWGLLKCAIFLSPRRTGHRRGRARRSAAHRGSVVLNRYLEDFYNRNAGGSTYVPHSLWEGGGVRWLPEPVSSAEPAWRAGSRQPRATPCWSIYASSPGCATSTRASVWPTTWPRQLVRVEIQSWIESGIRFPQPRSTPSRRWETSCGPGGRDRGKAAAEPQPWHTPGLRPPGRHHVAGHAAGDS